MRVSALSLALAVAVAAPLLGQNGAGGRRGNPLLRQRIEQQFMTQARNTMGLSDEQAKNMQRVVNEYAQRRLALEQEEAQLRQTLNQNLRPGVAGNADTVGALVDAINVNRVKYAEAMRDEMRELGKVLTPIQLGQFQLQQDRLLQRISDLLQQRKGQVAPGGIPPDAP